MGMVLGRISEEMPAHTVLARASTYEVRRYARSVVAECSYGAGGWGGGDDGSPFGALARYIGVFGKPQNDKEKIAMTAPVLVTPEPIAMTAPVLVSPGAEGQATHTMAFVLPASKYSSIADAPKPLDPRVTLRQLPERMQAVRTFSWNFRPEAAKKNLDILLDDLAKDGCWAVERGADGQPRWQAAGYNPPFALPFMKRNEVLVDVQPNPNCPKAEE